jgi:hypothetical protein
MATCVMCVPQSCLSHHAADSVRLWMAQGLILTALALWHRVSELNTHIPCGVPLPAPNHREEVVGGSGTPLHAGHVKTSFPVSPQALF